jgi:hypothetical protein
MATYNLIALNGGLRKKYENVFEVEVLFPGTVRLVGSVDDMRLSTQTMAVVQLGDGERLERAELWNQFQG